MIPAHRRSSAAAEARARSRTYRRLLVLCFVADGLLGLVALVAPDTLASLLGHSRPVPEAWPRAWGILLVGAGLLCLSGLRHPTFYRWPNWGGIALRFLLAVLFLLQGHGFLMLALWEAGSGALLLITYYRLAMAALASRP